MRTRHPSIPIPPFFALFCMSPNLTSLRTKKERKYERKKDNTEESKSTVKYTKIFSINNNYMNEEIYYVLRIFSSKYNGQFLLVYLSIDYESIPLFAQLLKRTNEQEYNLFLLVNLEWVSDSTYQQLPISHFTSFRSLFFPSVLYFSLCFFYIFLPSS